jgi:hypothetical protein
MSITPKYCIIDPIITLCKLAILYFLPINTKISIGEHILEIQTEWFFQGTIRKFYGDSRFDISFLNVPLLRAIEWYINDNTNFINEQQFIDSIYTITTFAIKGLEKLQRTTYKDDYAIGIIIQYFINMLNDAIEKKWDSTKYVKIDTENNILNDKIKNNHDKNIIIKIANDMKNINCKELSIDNDVIVKCIISLLHNQDIIFKTMIKGLIMI